MRRRYSSGRWKLRIVRWWIVLRAHQRGKRFTVALIRLRLMRLQLMGLPLMGNTVCDVDAAGLVRTMGDRCGDCGTIRVRQIAAGLADVDGRLDID